MWKYIRVVIEFTHQKELIDIMNKHGSEGWEAFNYNEIKSPEFGKKNKSIVLFKKKNHELSKSSNIL